MSYQPKTRMYRDASQHLFMMAKANGIGDAPMPRMVEAVTALNDMTPAPLPQSADKT